MTEQDKLIETFSSLSKSIAALRQENTELLEKSVKLTEVEQRLREQIDINETLRDSKTITKQNKELKEANYRLTIELEKRNNEIYALKNVKASFEELKERIHELERRNDALRSSYDQINRRLSDDQQLATISMFETWACSIAEKLGVRQDTARPRSLFLKAISDEIRKLLS